MRQKSEENKKTNKNVDKDEINKTDTTAYTMRK